MKIGNRTLRTPNLPMPQLRKPQGRIWKVFKALLPLLVIAAGVYIFYNFPALWDRFQYTIHKPTPGNPALLPTTTRSSSGIPVGGPQCGTSPIPYDNAGNPVRICDGYVYIPKIRVAAPIVWTKSTSEADIEADLLKGVVHYPGTAEPGQQGNVFLTGHSSFYWWVQTEYRNVFSLVPQLSGEDLIIVYYHGIRYTYKVYGTEEVTPKDTRVLQPTKQPELTLSTCVPVGTSYARKIIHSLQISPDPALNAPANTNTQLPSRLPGVR